MNATESDYKKYRGKCKELSEAEVLKDPTLTLVRGHYECPIWGAQPHWWCVTTTGEIVDPSVKQFPFPGTGTYVPFNGIVECAECGKEIEEDTAKFESNYGFCSTKCNMRFVGL
jgi:hypothetical protein